MKYSTETHETVVGYIPRSINYGELQNELTDYVSVAVTDEREREKEIHRERSKTAQPGGSDESLPIWPQSISNRDRLYTDILRALSRSYVKSHRTRQGKPPIVCVRENSASDRYSTVITIIIIKKSVMRLTPVNLSFLSGSDRIRLPGGSGIVADTREEAGEEEIEKS